MRDASGSAWTHSPRAGWRPVPPWAELSAAPVSFSRPLAGFMRFSTERFSHTHHTLRRQHSFNLREQLVPLEGLAAPASLCCALVGSCFSVSPMSGSHRLISSFPSQHRAIKLGVWFQVEETQGHMLEESHPGAGISGWHSDLSPSQRALRRGLRLSTFPAAQQTPSGASNVWLLWFGARQL